MSSNWLLGVALLAITISFCLGQSSFDAEEMCSLVPNGTFINNPTTCNSWIQCVNLQPIEGTCEDNLFYDLDTNSCVNSNSITCVSSNVCAPLMNGTGFVADPSSCKGYYYCANGIASHGTCTSENNYNPNTQSCIPNFTCTLPPNPYGYCNIVPEGVFIKTINTCNGWEMCWNNEIVYGTCPGTFYYSASTGECVYPDDVDCVDQTSAAPESGMGVCPEAGAFVSDNSTCNGYYYCQPTSNGGIVLKHADCPSGRFFDPDNGGECVNRTQIVCPYDRCAGMGTTYIQLSNESNDDCQGYAVCQYGVTIGSGYCPDNTYFNEVTQLCTTETISYPACALLEETTETTGEITVTETTGEITVTETATETDTETEVSTSAPTSTPTVFPTSAETNMD